ncbi:hypothetical protein VSAL_p840_59 (plasmid) [Aliivibrio salmonicida LFI1238]|uniref:Double-GTPase 1 domain-containing protein n=1 Tax=Aliivibrio salmonicida (strain LFI1238) TaxID=316275 RepID=B6ET30_ALISL|nr:hypothetical protein [Aliivibrio salmonicida]CAQ81918.1 hypothetical protein VSAL_p840_59 [Aliivibrio salmonicida LFI1238]
MNINPQESKVIFCGLPSSGKTSFLGALSYLAENDEVDKDLELAVLPKERLFFNELADKWVSCEPMLRTKISSSDKIEMTLKKSNQHFSIEMPDLSGETWSELWTEHKMDNQLISFLNKTSCVIFFIHVDELIVPMSICDEASIIKGESADHKDNNTKWNPSEHTPTQSIVIDLLRKLSTLLADTDKKLAIVLSAWDTLPNGSVPMSFLKKELPLLSQYLNCKFDYEQIKVFGVSAQGGSLNTPENQDILLSEDEPSKRIKITQDGIEYSADLTKILSWLINE